MPWHAIYEIETGRLFSTTDTENWETGPGYAEKSFAEAPDDDKMWDEATLSYIPRPPQVLGDRIDDFMGLVNDDAFFALLTDVQRQRLRAHVDMVFAEFRVYGKT